MREWGARVSLVRRSTSWLEKEKGGSVGRIGPARNDNQGKPCKTTVSQHLDKLRSLVSTKIAQRSKILTGQHFKEHRDLSRHHRNSNFALPLRCVVAVTAMVSSVRARRKISPTSTDPALG